MKKADSINVPRLPGEPEWDCDPDTVEQGRMREARDIKAAAGGWRADSRRRSTGEQVVLWHQQVPQLAAPYTYTHTIGFP